MDKPKFSQVTLASAVVMAASLASAAQAAEMHKPSQDKCFGIAKAGENNCAAAGAHSCAGMTKANYDGQDFKDVPKGTCEQMGGSLTPSKGTNPKMKDKQ